MKDGFIRETIKAVARMRYSIDVELTRRIKSARGEQFFNLCGRCTCCGKCCETPVIQVYPPLYYFKSVRWVTQNVAPVDKRV